MISANLYKDPRDDLVLFYFRDGANYASVYTQSKITSENIKWNLSLKRKRRLVRKISELCYKSNVKLIVNDDIDLLNGEFAFALNFTFTLIN